MTRDKKIAEKAVDAFITSLYSVAEDDEADAIERCMVRAGHLWKCACNYANVGSRNTCEGCRRARPGNEGEDT